MKSSVVTYLFLVNGIISISDANPWKDVMKVWVSSNIGVFELWNYTGVHCDVPNKLYRHNYIDQLHNNCIKTVYICFEHDSNQCNGFYIMFKNYADLRLQSILLSEPNDVADNKKGYVTKNRDTSIIYRVLLNKDHFEYALLLNSTDKMFAGIYQNNKDPQSPQFIVNWNGTAYQAGYNFSQLDSDRDVILLRISLDMQSGCDLPPDPNVSNSVCPAKPFITVPRTEINITRLQTAVFECQITAFPNATIVGWNIRLVSGIKHFVNTSTYKYEILFNNSLLLKVKNASFTDVGTYACIASNSFGETNSNEVTLNVFGVVVESSQTSYNAIYSEPVELNCTITYRPDLKQVLWNYVVGSGALLPVNISDAAKYSGSTISYPHLLLLYPVFTDPRTYVCTAANDYEKSIGLHVAVNVTRDYPEVHVNASHFVVNPTEQITLPCTVRGQPKVSSVKWYQTVNSVITREISTTPSSPSLNLTNITVSDAGMYICSAVNAVGQANSSELKLDVKELIPMCPCTCEYKQRLDYWATQIQDNKTLEEWRLILAPIVEEIRKNLTINKANLKSTTRKLTSAPDRRASSTGFGVLGIVIIIVFAAAIVLVDITSIWGHINAIREMVNRRNVIEQA